MSFDKVYEDAKDFHVATTILYTDETSLYLDKEKTVKATYDQVKDLCFKGAIVYHLTDAIYYGIANFKDNTTSIVVTLTDDTAITVNAED